MKPISDFVFDIIIFGGMAAWVLWGWRSWFRARPEKMEPRSFFSISGFASTSLAALLTIGVRIYSQFVDLKPFYDPLLLRVGRDSFMLSTAGLVLAFVDLRKENPLRWKSPVLSVFLLLFWFAVGVSQ
jgi:hypothetical protein